MSTVAWFSKVNVAMSYTDSQTYFNTLEERVQKICNETDRSELFEHIRKGSFHPKFFRLLEDCPDTETSDIHLVSRLIESYVGRWFASTARIRQEKK